MLTLDQIKGIAPSVLAVQPSSKVSDKYKFIPTTIIIEDLIAQGWEPNRARECHVRNLANEGYQKHIVQFRRHDFSPAKVDDLVPEIVLTNSHNTSASFQLHAGIFRLVCTNGLVVADATFAHVSIKHIGYASKDVHAATATITQAFPQIIGKAEKMLALPLTDEDQETYALNAALIKYQTKDVREIPFNANELLRPRRTADNNPSLWHTYNRIQENLMKGGTRYLTKNERAVSTRPVKGIDEDLRVNKALWQIAERSLEAGKVPEILEAEYKIN
jgi:hypothetical protein